MTTSMTTATDATAPTAAKMVNDEVHDDTDDDKEPQITMACAMTIDDDDSSLSDIPLGKK